MNVGALTGYRSNAAHVQMYMLEGIGRWNVNRAGEAVDLAETSGTRIYDARLQDALNKKAQQVLGQPLIPEFTTANNPTGM